MKIGYNIGLAAAIVLSQSLNAQSCSGGVDGGTDATGNQCNAVASVVAYTTEPSAVPPAHMNGAGRSGSMRTPSVRQSKSSLPQFRSTALATPVSRFAATVIAPPNPLKSEGTSEATCSGGVDGGMDANGSQCSKQPAATGTAIGINTTKP
jgi:hypothetical protein